MKIQRGSPKIDNAGSIAIQRSNKFFPVDRAPLSFTDIVTSTRLWYARIKNLAYLKQPFHCCFLPSSQNSVSVFFSFFETFASSRRISRLHLESNTRRAIVTDQLRATLLSRVRKTQIASTNTWISVPLLVVSLLARLWKEAAAESSRCRTFDKRRHRHVLYVRAAKSLPCIHFARTYAKKREIEKNREK